MDYSQLINSILVMGMLILAGLVASKLNILTEEGAAMNSCKRITIIR